MAIIQSMGTNEQELEKQEQGQFELRVESSNTDTYTPLMSSIKKPRFIDSNNSNGQLNLKYMDSDVQSRAFNHNNLPVTMPPPMDQSNLGYKLAASRGRKREIPLKAMSQHLKEITSNKVHVSRQTNTN
jgi:hypothetical protein